MSDLHSRLQALADELMVEAMGLREDDFLMSESNRVDGVVATAIENIVGRIEEELHYEEPPYIEKVVSETIREYNPKFGDTRRCRCGHAYSRHFDSHDNMDACGCKYCDCWDFVEDDVEYPS